ncbi:hypothetical protein L6164_019797 [Bauhinia variegata]|uniref:Uncharacterized protein n=1 Tax=Bauhinia variegata TaxID=167791 RepID=A0ACB9MT89_BAUVA|nr:hypothetical protein L6164_019797 [Bauhinia variegata]
MEIIYQPHIDRELELLVERIYPPRVCVDNDSRGDCTVVKVDSANKHGILLEMVQVLTDLDLIISKSYISSDGRWFMDVFHVTDEFGNKLTDEKLMLHIQQALCASRRGGISREIAENASAEKTALEVTVTDRPGLLSELSAVLVEWGCRITAAEAWTHNDRAACIVHVEDASKPGPITDPIRLAHIEEQLEIVVEAHDGKGEKRSVRSTAAGADRSHTERRLHQLMSADRDYERCRACECEGEGENSGPHNKGCDGTHVSISRCEDKGYWVVNVRSRDRPKLLFDTVCVLTICTTLYFMQRLGPKEYFIRHKDSWSSNLERESERQKLTLCLVAAIERRVSHVCLCSTAKGLRIEVCSDNRMGLLSDVTRLFRENGLSISRAEIGTQGEKAVGSFYVTDSSGQQVNPDIVDFVRKQVGGAIVARHASPYSCRMRVSETKRTTQETKTSTIQQRRPRFSIGNILWSQLERLSTNFGSIRS